MGVLYFFKYIMDNPSYSSKILNLNYNKNNKNITIKNGKYHQPDVLLIDCNALFHPCCREVYQPENPSLLRPKIESDDQKKLRAFITICKKIIELVDIAKPTKMVYLAVDGVAGLCKQSQQRKRRFKTAIDRSPEDWDSSVLSTGTVFMDELCEFIKNYFTTNKLGIRVIINDSNIPGEGEHKLVKYVKDDKQYRSYCIYSPDADLIMLGLLINKQYVSILRENIYDYIKADYFVVSMFHFRQALFSEIKKIATTFITPENINNSSVESVLSSPQNVTVDFVLFLFMIGNDFIPNISCLNITNNAIPTLIQTYASTIIDHGYLYTNNFNKNAIHDLFSKLSILEPKLLISKFNSKKKCIVPDHILNNSITVVDDIYTIDFNSYRSNYYLSKFNVTSQEDIMNICNEYLKGMSFVIKYYSDGIPTFDWFYKFHYSPLLSDLKTFTNSQTSLEYIFSYKPPLAPLESLSSIIHPSSFNLLPTNIANLLTKRSIIDSDFPREFKVDLEGKYQLHEAIVLLPTIEYKKIKLLLKKYDINRTYSSIVDIKA